jgi:hypothetical protein
MPWSLVRLDKGEDRPDGKATRLIERFAEIYVANGSPTSAVMWDGTNRVMDGLVYLFSPGATEIAEELITSVGGSKLDTYPKFCGLPVLIGDTAAAKTLLPDLVEGQRCGG